MHNLEFGLTDYSNMKRMIEIYKGTKSLMLYEGRMKMALAKGKKTKKYLKKIR